MFDWIKCLIFGHKWYELFDPDDIFQYKFMCERCLKFTPEVK